MTYTLAGHLSVGLSRKLMSPQVIIVIMQNHGWAETAPPPPHSVADSPSAAVAAQRGFSIKRGLALAFWLGASLLASYGVMRYDFQPGRLGQAQTAWPGGTGIQPAADALTVLAFLHPRCPCTRATVKQLIGALRRYPQVRLTAVVFVPAGPVTDDGWQNGEYVRDIRASIPDAHIVLDPGGAKAGRFGAHTSGTILVYDRRRVETFRGGITARRGGEEDNAGFHQFEQALTEEQGTNSRTSWPVFGCSLQDSTLAAPVPENARETP